MAQQPTLDETVRAILDQIRKYNTRSDEIFPMTQVQVKLCAAGYRGEDLNPALEKMVQDGWLIPGSGPHWTLTSDGYAAL